MTSECGDLLLGTPGNANATRLLLLGAGELGKEVAIEAQRLGLEVVAVDRYESAPAMQVAHRFHVIDMLDGDALEAVVRRERPAFILPEVEAIATARLPVLENAGFCVVPTARAVQLTMDREGIRRLATESLGLPTSPFRFATSAAECRAAVAEIGVPCFVKPAMSSSGKGQTMVRVAADADSAWEAALHGGRAGSTRVIVEGRVEFDLEITLLTVRHAGGTAFCAPIGHLQVDGDYRESWQPQPLTPRARARSEEIARVVTEALGGFGVFGVELFIRGDDVWFSEVSPRPHDTGLVTLISQDLSEFALHLRAALGLPVPAVTVYGPSASVALLGEGQGREITFGGLAAALATPATGLRLFGKPEVKGRRRLGVALARGDTLDAARARARDVAAAVQISIQP